MLNTMNALHCLVGQYFATRKTQKHSITMRITRPCQCEAKPKSMDGSKKRFFLGWYHVTQKFAEKNVIIIVDCVIGKWDENNRRVRY